LTICVEGRRHGRGPTQTRCGNDDSLEQLDAPPGGAVRVGGQAQTGVVRLVNESAQARDPVRVTVASVEVEGHI
jgi:hypothetical protein